ncbi:MAG: PorP/SprF family type IX secretion system membrane protein [Panacibacter sp.]
MRNLFLTWILLCAAVIAKAQDPHFSQFYASPLTLNPAFTGKFDGNVRVAGNYRNQWPSINRAFQTATVAVDFPILKKVVDEFDRFGVGLTGYTDKGADGAISFNYISLSTAYHKALDEDGYKQLGLGFQATYSNMLINTSKLTFENQLDLNGNWTRPSGETFDNVSLNKSFFDLNAGLLYTQSTTDRNNVYAGVSLYHITRPDQTFNPGPGYLNYNLDMRTTVHAGGYFPTGPTSTVHISALYSTQAGASETVVGAAMQVSTTDMNTADNPVSVYAGAWLRLGDAFIPYIGLEYGSVRFGATYDINTSALKAASQSRGGIELSLIYIAKTPGSKGVPCPKF